MTRQYLHNEVSYSINEKEEEQPIQTIGAPDVEYIQRGAGTIRAAYQIIRYVYLHMNVACAAFIIH